MYLSQINMADLLQDHLYKKILTNQ